MAKSTLPERFWPNVNKTPTCWLWTGQITPSGYGIIALDTGRKEVAHRTSWRLAGRFLDPELTLDHLCRVRHCVNPDHLDMVPMRTNLLRGINRAAVSMRRPTCINGHLRTPENTRIDKRGKYEWRQCRECRNEPRRKSFDDRKVEWPDIREGRPACQSEHRPEHWKHGQSPRATRLVVFADGRREYLCKRCVGHARRTISTDPRDVVDHTEDIP